MAVGGVAIGQLCVPGGTAEDADADALQLAVNQIVVRLQSDGNSLTCFKDNSVRIIFMGIALEVVVIETHLDVVGPIAAQGVDLHIQADIGSILTLCATEGNFVAIIAETVADDDGAIHNGCLTGTIGCRIAGILRTADTFGITQLNSHIQRALQTDTGNGNRVPVGGIAIRQCCIPGGAAEDTQADAGQLAINQILLCIQPDTYLLTCLDSHLVCEDFMGVAFKVVGVEPHLNVTEPVAAQGVDLHIQIEIGSVFGLFAIQSELVTVVAEAVGNNNCAVLIAGDAGAVGVGKAGAGFSGCPGSCA